MLAQRMYARKAHIHLSKLHHKNILDFEYEKLSTVANDLINSNLIFIDDQKLTYIEYLIADIETRSLTENLQAIFIDYLLLIQSKKKHNSRHLEISYILDGLKRIAKDLNIPLVFLHHPDKALSKAESRRPAAAHLKESGDIWIKTDDILGIYAPDKCKEETQHNPVYVAEVYSIKLKDQVQFSTWLNFNGHFQEFTDGERPLFVNDNRKRRKE